LAAATTDAFQGDDERVFCHPQTGGTYKGETFKAALERAFAAAGLEWPTSHDG
jgi:hypothetical protein